MVYYNGIPHTSDSVVHFPPVMTNGRIRRNDSQSLTSSRLAGVSWVQAPLPRGLWCGSGVGSGASILNQHPGDSTNEGPQATLART